MDRAYSSDVNWCGRCDTVSQNTIYSARWLLDGRSRQAISNGSVRVVGKSIAGVEAGLDRPNIPGAIVRSFGSNTTIIPGLIDAHVHLVCTGGYAAIEESARQPEEVLESRAARNAETALRAGTTTVRDAGGKGFSVVRLRNRLQERPGALRILAAGMPMTTPGGHLHFYGLQAETAEEVVASVARLDRAGVDYVKVMASAGIQTPGNNPAASQYALDVLKALVQVAHSRNMHVAAHAHSVASILNCVAAEVDTIEHFSWIGSGDDDDGLLDEVCHEVADREISVDPTTIGLDRSVDEQGGLTISQREFIGRIIAGRRRSLGALARSGVNIIAGTDAGSTRVGFDSMVDGLEVLSELIKWSPIDAINAATGSTAKALGLAGQVGVLAPGKAADFVVVNGNASVDLTALRRVLAVVKDGLLVWE